jgi:hypothetical protein
MKMERLLHYVWKYKLYSSAGLVTVDGLPVSVLDQGIHNTADAGPDFFNAKLNIGGTTWVGNIEVHDKASDWIRHNHDKNKAYDSVILHIVGLCDADIYRTNGETIPQAVLTVPEAIRRNIDWLLHRDVSIPCLHALSEVDPVFHSSWLDVLLSERLERKMLDIFKLLDQYANDWNEVFYITLARNFGFGINSDAFEQLAKSLPLRCILKQRSSSSQVEAMLFGQAGMLQSEEQCHYYRLLQQEYAFLRHKFGLKPLDASLFRNLRIRPNNFPHLKLAQLASILREHDTLFSVILKEEDTAQLRSYFRLAPSFYWDTHYHFRHASPQKEKLLGENAVNILLINTVAPLLFAFGRKNNLPEYAERAIALLEQIPLEQNTIVSTFCRAGIRAYHAGDSQALIQLKREYCEKKKCLYCQIGFQLLKRANICK